LKFIINYPAVKGEYVPEWVRFGPNKDSGLSDEAIEAKAFD
jgi:hypothetical protein